MVDLWMKLVWSPIHGRRKKLSVMLRRVLIKSGVNHCSKSIVVSGFVFLSTWCSKPCSNQALRKSEKTSDPLGDVQSPFDEIPPPSAQDKELPSFGIGACAGNFSNAFSQVLTSGLCVTKWEDDLASCCVMRWG